VTPEDTRTVRESLSLRVFFPQNVQHAFIPSGARNAIVQREYPAGVLAGEKSEGSAHLTLHHEAVEHSGNPFRLKLTITVRKIFLNPFSKLEKVFDASFAPCS
jgi:hypothetical protein